MIRRTNLLSALAWFLAAAATQAHTGGHPSVHDTAAGIIERLKQTLTTRELRDLEAGRGARLLTPEERHVFSTGHVTFIVNQPVVLTLFHDRSLAKDPFWLQEPGWKNRPGTVQVGSTTFDLWERSYPAGEIGLGVNSLRGGGRHYFVALQGKGSGPLVVDDLYPGILRTTNFVAGAAPWADREEVLPPIPEGFSGQTLLQTLHARRDDGQLVGRVRLTSHPATRQPDHVVLTWSGDPRTTQAVQWRTSTAVSHGAVVFIPVGERERRLVAWQRVDAATTVLRSSTTLNDPVVHRHTVELTGLTPGTTYAYRVGDGTAGRWSDIREFTTAPQGSESFSFVYMGDAQNGLDTWGRLVRGSFRARPDVAFYLMAGDLVNRGNERDDWDEFFENARGVFDRRPLVPVLGNHECQGGRPTLYLEQFALPRNGPRDIEPERAYTLAYGNALLVVLDSNLAPEKQAPWLEEQLKASRARWKIVAYHHPAYSSGLNRDNKALRAAWTPIFDAYGVDLALQGHDHAYLRTHPLRAGEKVAPSKGTTYIVSVSGTKWYPQAEHPETAVGFTDVATWQVLDLQVHGDRLFYKAYDRFGRLKDEFVIDKSEPASN